MVRFVLIVILVLHGIGHLLFLGNAWGYWAPTSDQESFVTRLGLGQLGEGIISLLWLMPTLSFILGVSFLIQRHDARALLLIAAASSLVLIILWWGSLVPGSAFFALVVDAAVIAFALWRPAGFEAAHG